jgi:DNA-binding PadR family transcriptional regulator
MTETPLREPAFLVLTALAAQPQHGYGVIEDVAHLGRPRPAAHRLALRRARPAPGSGLIEVDREEIVASRLRRYYRLTGAGIARLTAEADQMWRNAAAASGRLRALRQKPLGGAA